MMIPNLSVQRSFLAFTTEGIDSEKIGSVKLCETFRYQFKMYHSPRAPGHFLALCKEKTKANTNFTDVVCVFY